MVLATATAEYTRPWLYPEQQAAVFDPARYSVIEASTKSGKTIGCLVWLLEKAMAGRSGQNFWWVAPWYRTAAIAFRRMRAGIPRNLYTANETEMTITLRNGARVCFRSGEKPETLYGEDVFACVIDEFTRLRKEAWWAIRSTITATRASVRFIGNVNGRKNWGYTLARRAEAGEPGMGYHLITADDAIRAGVLDAAEVEGARSDLPGHIFRELYYGEPSEDGNNPFGLDYIRACIMPLADTAPVVWGWDLAKSVDWTVGIGLDVQGRTCRVQRFQRSWEDTVRVIRAETAGVRTLVDSTGVGDPPLEALQKAGGGYVEGFKFTQGSKQQLMEGLAIAIQRREVTFPDGPIVSELEAFEYEYTRTGVRYTAAEGMHDDCVMALALAVRHRVPAGVGLWADMLAAEQRTLDEQRQVRDHMTPDPREDDKDGGSWALRDF